MGYVALRDGQWPRWLQTHTRRAVADARHREPGEPSAEKRPRFADSYGLVLVLLIVSFFVAAVTGDHHYGRLTTLVVLAATTWLALRASQVERRLLRLAVTLIPLVDARCAIVLSILGSDETWRRTSTASLTALLVIVAPVAIVRRLATHPVINLNTFYGAVCVYLLIAMFFASMLRPHRRGSAAIPSSRRSSRRPKAGADRLPLLQLHDDHDRRLRRPHGARRAWGACWPCSKPSSASST